MSISRQSSLPAITLAIFWLVSGLFLVACPVQANDIAREVRIGSVGADYSDGYYVEIGVGGSLGNTHKAQENPADDDEIYLELELLLSGEFRYKGFFGGFTEGTFDGINFGYNFFNTRRLSFDFLASSFNGELDIDYEEIEDSDSEAARTRKLLNRDTFYNGAGLRATAYLEDYILQFRLVSDIHRSNGLQGSARIGRHWQIRNWNFHAIGGFVYDSTDLNRYLWGVSEDEASERFPEYNPGAGWKFQFETGSVYPLRKDWVFRSLLRYTNFSKEVERSPLMVNPFSLSLGVSINYVF